MVFDGTADYMTIPDHDDFNFGTGDFTIECWLKSKDTSDQSWTGIIDRRDSYPEFEGWSLGLSHSSGYPRFHGIADSSITGTTNCFDAEWHHVAISRTSGTMKLFVDGSLDASSTLSGNVDRDLNVHIGAAWPNVSGSDGVAEFFGGYIDDVRITKGLGIYTGAFTAPTSALTTTWGESTGIVANTDASKVVVLIHGDNSKNRPAGGIVDSSVGSELIFGGRD